MQSNVAVADSEDQQALANAVTQLLERHWPAGTAHKQVGDPGSVSELALWPQLAALGLAGLPVAEAAGGAGGRWADLAVALEACGAVLAPTPAVAVAGAIGTLTALGGDGTDGSHAADLLAQISAGDVVATVAWTQRPGLWGARGAFQAEPGSGEILVSGTAELILSPEADRVLLLADAPDSAGTPVLLLVDTAAEGVSVRRIDGLDLLRPLGALALTRARAVILATGDAATSAVRHGLATAAAALASELVGLAGHCLDGAVGYAAERHQFGHPIGSFQAVKHICADMLTGVELARAAARHLAGLLDAEADADAGAHSGRVRGRSRRGRGAGPAQGGVGGAGGVGRLHPDPRRHRLQLGARGPPVLPAGGRVRAAVRHGDRAPDAARPIERGGHRPTAVRPPPSPRRLRAPRRPS